MTKVKALISFNAYGIQASTGQEFEIGDKGKRLDLEKLGWIEPLEYETGEVSEELEVKESKRSEARQKDKIGEFKCLRNAFRPNEQPLLLPLPF